MNPLKMLAPKPTKVFDLKMLNYKMLSPENLLSPCKSWLIKNIDPLEILSP